MKAPTANINVTWDIYTGPLGAFGGEVCARFFYCWNILVRASTKKIAGVIFEFLPILAKNGQKRPYFGF